MRGGGNTAEAHVFVTDHHQLAWKHMLFYRGLSAAVFWDATVAQLVVGNLVFPISACKEEHLGTGCAILGKRERLHFFSCFALRWTLSTSHCSCHFDVSEDCLSSTRHPIAAILVFMTRRSVVRCHWFVCHWIAIFWQFSSAPIPASLLSANEGCRLCVRAYVRLCSQIQWWKSTLILRVFCNGHLCLLFFLRLWCVHSAKCSRLCLGHTMSFLFFLTWAGSCCLAMGLEPLLIICQLWRYNYLPTFFFS